MGYSIQYASWLNKKFKIKKRYRWNKKSIYSVVGCITVLMFGIITPLRNWLREFVIPGDADITAAAFSDMLQQLENGETVKSAFSAFCKEILIHG